MTYLTPQTLDQALAALASTRCQILAGGTDVFAALGDRPPRLPLLDITRIQGLRGIARDANGWRIGATTTWTDIVRAPLPGAFDGLKAAARQVGSGQIQNTGTLAGNLVNASPAADGVPALLALDARVELASPTGRRTVGLATFIEGVRRTVIAADEIVTAILIPALPDAAVGAFAKLGSRAYLVISIAMVAAVVVPGGGRVAAARVAVGSCSPVAVRLPALERALVGLKLCDMAHAVTAEHLATLSPIDDVRGSADYRAEAAATLLSRLLADLAIPAREAA